MARSTSQTRDHTAQPFRLLEPPVIVNRVKILLLAALMVSLGCLSDPADLEIDEEELDVGQGTEDIGPGDAADAGDGAPDDGGSDDEPDVTEPEDDADVELCEPESTSQLCEAKGYNCGSSDVVDQCENPREIRCGQCVSPEVCKNNQCSCAPEVDIENEVEVKKFCEDAEASCGELDDGCGGVVQCGECDEGLTCATLEDSYECVASEECEPIEFCDEDCGTIPDGCGGTVPCNDECGDYDVCSNENQCICQGESDDALCAIANAQCGTIVVEDRCKVDQTVDCGGCVFSCNEDTNRCNLF